MQVMSTTFDPAEPSALLTNRADSTSLLMASGVDVKEGEWVDEEDIDWDVRVEFEV